MFILCVSRMCYKINVIGYIIFVKLNGFKVIMFFNFIYDVLVL